jgi:hypothetical protein
VNNLIGGVDRKTLEGTYVDGLGVSKYQFKDDGTVLWTNMMGSQLEWKYERDGDTIKVLMPYGATVLTLRSNGSLQGPGLMGPLTRQQSASGGGGDGGGNGASGGSGALAARLSKPETEAMDLVVAELASHYLKTPDGWTTAVSESINPPFTSTMHFLRQFRELAPDGVDADEVGAADRLNGFEWVGEVSFKETPAREAGDPGQAFMHGLEPLAFVFVNRAQGRWTRWVDIQPRSVRVWKLNGVWKVPKGSSLLSGQPATPEDFQRAAVR